MTVHGEVNLEVGEPSVAVPAHGSSAFGAFRLAQVLLLGLTIAGVVVGLRVTVPGGSPPPETVAFALTLVWALVGFVDTGAADRAGSRVSPYHLLAGIDALVAMVALTAGRKAETLHATGAARGIATMAAIMVTAISFHFLLALPDGRLGDTARRTVVGVAYVAALGVGLGFVVIDRPFTVVDGATSWTLAALLAVAPMRARYAASIGARRERLQWFGVGVTLAATATLIVTVLHLLVGWPGALGAVAAGTTVLIPLGLLAGESGRVRPHGSRVLVQVLAVTGRVELLGPG